MSRKSINVCKLCRREGEKLFLKGSRCETAKCAINRRNYQPGVHPWSRGKPSEYGIQLREKQKAKRYYGVQERQFKRYFGKAERASGNTGENLLLLLERRLDNVVHMLGLAPSRRAARQIIAHGHIQVNSRKCDIPAALVRVGDTVSIRGREKTKNYVKASLEERKGHSVPDWVTFDETTVKGTIKSLPKREDVQIPIEEQLIVELMSK